MLFLLILLIPQTFGILQPIQSEYLHKSSLSKCLLRAVNCCMTTGEVVVVVVSSFETGRNSAVQFEPILLEDLSKSDKVSYVIKKATNKEVYSGSRKTVGAYIIHMRQNLADLVESLRLLKREDDFNAHAKFFVVSTYTFENFSEMANFSTKLIWDLRLVNVIGFFPEEELSETYQVYTAHLFGKCGYSILPSLLDHCTHGEAARVDKWFLDKIPKDLDGCQIQVRTSLIEPFVISRDDIIPTAKLVGGLEIKLLNTIAHHLNLIINYSITESHDVYGKFYANSSLTGSYLDLREKNIDLMVGYVVSRPETQQIFDTVSSYFQDSLVFCVPHAKRVEDWIKMLKVSFNSAVIMQVMCYILTTRLIYWSSRWRPEESSRYKKYLSISPRILKIYLGITEDYLPHTDLNRFLVILGIIGSFFYRSTYFTYSARALLSTGWGYQIHTYEEIWKKTIQYYPLCLNYFDTQELSRATFELCDDYENCLNRTAMSEEYATCMPKLNVQYLFRKFLDEEGSARLYCPNRPIVTYPIEMLMWKGHPLKPRINDLVNRLSAGGFIYHWEKEIFDDILFNTKTKNFVPSEKIVLTLLHLSFPLVTVMICHFSSTLVLIGEILIYRRGNKRRVRELA